MTCIIRAKMNIIQIDLACQRIFTMRCGVHQVYGSTNAEYIQYYRRNIHNTLQSPTKPFKNPIKTLDSSESIYITVV